METSSRGVKLTTYLHTVPRLRMGEAAPLLTHKSSWSAQRRLTLPGGCMKVAAYKHSPTSRHKSELSTHTHTHMYMCVCVYIYTTVYTQL